MAQRTYIARRNHDADFEALTCTSLTISGGSVTTGGVSCADAETVIFGTGLDVTFQWDGTNLITSLAADDSLWEIGDSAATQLSTDIKWYANENNGASYVYFDASGNLVYTTGVDLQFKDNDYLVFGSGAGATGDVTIRWDATDLDMDATGASAAFNVGSSGHLINVTQLGTYTSGVDGQGYDLTIYGDTALSNMVWDTSDDALEFTAAKLSLFDNSQLNFGNTTASPDVYMNWDATNLNLLPTGAAEAWLIGGDAHVINTTLKGSLTIGKDGTGHDVTFYTDTGSSKIVVAQANDAIEFTAAKLTLFDNSVLGFGNTTAAPDITMKWDATNLVMASTAAASTWLIGGDAKLINPTIKGAITVGKDDTGHDITVYGATASSVMVWDESDDALEFTAAKISMFDNSLINFGNTTATPDVTLGWDGTSLELLAVGAAEAFLIGEVGHLVNVTLTGGLTVGVDNEGYDVTLFGDTASSKAVFVAANDALEFTAAKLTLFDNSVLGFGNTTAAPDVTIKYDGTDLLVALAADDDVIKIGNGTNSADVILYGNIATATATWDASASSLVLSGPVRPAEFNALSNRYELKWVAGQRGKPGVNGDIQNAAEATRMIADPDFEILGTSSTSNLSTWNVEGGITLTTAGADHDQMILAPHLDANQTAWSQVTWGTDQETHWECEITTGASIASTIIWAGLKLTNTSTTATDDDQVFFRYQGTVNDGEWQAVSSIADSDDAHDTNVAAATTTTYHLKIVILSNRTAQMYINGVLVETTAALTTEKDLIPYIGVQAEGAGAQKVLNVRGEAISRKFA